MHGDLARSLPRSFYGCIGYVHWLSLAGLTFAGLFPLVNPFAALPLFASLTHEGPARWRKEMAIRAAIFVMVILLVTEYVGNGLLNFFGLSLGMLQIAGGLIVANTAWQMSTGAPPISQKEEHHVKRQVFRAMKDSTVHAVTAATTSVAKATQNATEAVTDLPHRLLSSDATLQASDGSPVELTATDTASLPEAPVAPQSSPGQAEGVTEAGPTDKHSDNHGAGHADKHGGKHGDVYVEEHGEKPRADRVLPDIAFSPIAMPILAGPGAMGVVIGLVAQNKGAIDSVGIAIGIVLIAFLSGLTLLAATPINRLLGAHGVMVLQRIFGFITLGIAVALVSTGISSLFGIPLVN